MTMFFLLDKRFLGNREVERACGGEPRLHLSTLMMQSSHVEWGMTMAVLLSPTMGFLKEVITILI